MAWIQPRMAGIQARGSRPALGDAFVYYSFIIICLFAFIRFHSFISHLGKSGHAGQLYPEAHCCRLLLPEGRGEAGVFPPNRGFALQGLGTGDYQPPSLRSLAPTGRHGYQRRG